jgi:hypothetical protein
MERCCESRDARFMLPVRPLHRPQLGDVQLCKRLSERCRPDRRRQTGGAGRRLRPISASGSNLTAVRIGATPKAIAAARSSRHGRAEPDSCGVRPPFGPAGNVKRRAAVERAGAVST